jgi:hypothetical protein
VSVEIRPGARGFIGGQVGVVTWPPDTKPEHILHARQQGLGEGVFAAVVSNKGRGPTTVASVDLAFDDGAAVGDAALDPPLPFTLAGESEQSWYLSATLVANYANALEQVVPTGAARALRARVRLGSGKVVLSRNSLPIRGT